MYKLPQIQSKIAQILTQFDPKCLGYVVNSFKIGQVNDIWPSVYH